MDLWLAIYLEGALIETAPLLTEFGIELEINELLLVAERLLY